mgnify:CR=1 FL=1
MTTSSERRRLPTAGARRPFTRVFPPRFVLVVLPAFLCARFLVLLAPDSVLLHAADAKRPNVLFILTDDQGWADAKFAGHPYVQTPNLDRLASQGTWFKQFYVAATVCSPSRCAFLTSHYPARHAIHGHFADHALNQARSMPNWLDPQTVTVTKLLRDAGYATGHFGKWHLGGGDGAPETGQPLAHVEQQGRTGEYPDFGNTARQEVAHGHGRASLRRHAHGAEERLDERPQDECGRNAQRDVSRGLRG